MVTGKHFQQATVAGYAAFLLAPLGEGALRGRAGRGGFASQGDIALVVTVFCIKKAFSAYPAGFFSYNFNSNKRQGALRAVVMGG